MFGAIKNNNWRDKSLDATSILLLGQKTFFLLFFFFFCRTSFVAKKVCLPQ